MSDVTFIFSILDSGFFSHLTRARSLSFTEVKLPFTSVNGAFEQMLSLSSAEKRNTFHFNQLDTQEEKKKCKCNLLQAFLALNWGFCFLFLRLKAIKFYCSYKTKGEKIGSESKCYLSLRSSCRPSAVISVQVDAKQGLFVSLTHIQASARKKNLWIVIDIPNKFCVSHIFLKLFYEVIMKKEFGATFEFHLFKISVFCLFFFLTHLTIIWHVWQKKNCSVQRNIF